MTRIGILTSGGDAPGMNAAIRAATVFGLVHGCDVLGVRHGYRGLLRGDFEALDSDAVAPILRSGGTVLGSARCPEFLEAATRDQARQVLRDRGIEGLVVIGGNGSLAGALALSDPAECGDSPPPRVVGVPASIDNDVALTGMSIGVDTAMNTIVEACDNINDTASAHDRTFIIEVMGRDSGYLAMTAAVATGADAVLFPEAGRSEDELVTSVVDAVLSARKRRRRTQHSLIIKAEGVSVATDTLKRRVDEQLATHAGDAPVIETRVTVLGHVVRGGRPTAFDRLLAGRLGRVAVRSLVAGETRKMAAWVPPGALPLTATAPSPLDPHCCLVDLDTVLTETRRMHEGENPLVKWRTEVFGELEGAMRV